MRDNQQLKGGSPCLIHYSRSTMTTVVPPFLNGYRRKVLGYGRHVYIDYRELTHPSLSLPVFRIGYYAIKKGTKGDFLPLRASVQIKVVNSDRIKEFYLPALLRNCDRPTVRPTNQQTGSYSSNNGDKMVYQTRG